MSIILELADKINEAAEHIKANTTWKHFKGDIYRVKNFVINTENGEVGVIYTKIDGPTFNLGESYIDFVRPFKEWFEDVEIEPKVFTPRFKRVEQISRWHTKEEIENF